MNRLLHQSKGSSSALISRPNTPTINEMEELQAKYKFENLTDEDSNESSIEEWSPLDDPDASFSSSFESRSINVECFDETMSDAYRPDSFLEVPDERTLTIQAHCVSVRHIPRTKEHTLIFKCKSMANIAMSSLRHTLSDL